MRCLIVDDHPLITKGFAAALIGELKGATVDVAHDLKGAREAIANQRYDLAIVDINLPDGRAHQLFSLTELAGKYPSYSLLLSGSQDRDDVLSALQAGATAFISKTVDFSDLMLAVSELLALDPAAGPYWYDMPGRKFLPARHLFPRGTALSPKENEVYGLIREGLSDKEIAYRLNRSIHTVRVQIRSIRRKRGETRRASASAA